MQLGKKRELTARTLKVGKEKVIFNKERLDEIKEAITKQDIRELLRSNAIFIKEKKGKKKIKKRKTRRRDGSIKKKVNTRKRDYMTITRKLRAFVAEVKKKKIITNDEFRKLRKEIRMKNFKSKSQMKDRLTNMIKERDE